jgi:hypothetical protein
VVVVVASSEVALVGVGLVEAAAHPPWGVALGGGHF